jgi:hypothetical protein
MSGTIFLSFFSLVKVPHDINGTASLASRMKTGISSLDMWCSFHGILIIVYLVNSDWDSVDEMPAMSPKIPCKLA